MKAVCKYCGKIHEKSFDCGKKPQPKKKYNNKESFRWSNDWKKKRNDIRDRDNHLCRWCLVNGRITYKDLSVHHITPLEEDYERRLDDDNLITLCDRCHEDAESGKISKVDLLRLAKESPGV